MQTPYELIQAKMGRKIAEHNFYSLVVRTENILNKTGLSDRVAILTYGSCGGRFLSGNSDTDFTLIHDGSLTKDDLIPLQRELFIEFSGKPWIVAFKAWERVKVNPMDLLSVRFIGGNKRLFKNTVLNAPDVLSLTSRDVMVSNLAGNDLHLEFMASSFFSRLLKKYHPTNELPLEISRGDIKYFTGGIRWIQFIFMIAALYAGNRFLADTDINILVEKGILSDDDIKELNAALDFFLTVKELCLMGSNIFFGKNLIKITESLQMTKEKIASQYDLHSKNIQRLCRKIHARLIKDYPQNQGIFARVTTDIGELSVIVDSDNLSLWRTIALRSDIPTIIRQKLKGKIIDRRKTHPHTMIDELEVMLAFSSFETPDESVQRAEEEKNIWLTDQIVKCLDDTLQYCVNNPAFIRLAIHRSFFELFKVGIFADIQSFYRNYFDRVIKYFHCHTLYPDDCVAIAKSACEQILKSGLFKPERLTLLELHLTNNCNLNCSWCTYKTKNKEHFLFFSDLKRVVELSPMEILIAGGGEPTLYHDGENDFNDVVLFLRKKLPGVRLRLITNGTYIPDGEWLSEIDEVSISLDEGNKENYKKYKGQELFDTVWENICTYLSTSPVSLIRVTQVFDEHNILTGIDSAEKLYQIRNAVSACGIDGKSCTFMLFPLADDNQQNTPYAISALSNTTLELLKKRLRKYEKSKPDLFRFLQNNTNVIDSINATLKVSPAEKCWTVAHYSLIGADRKIYPCFAMCSTFKTTYVGDVDSPFDDLISARRSLFVNPPLQCRNGCRPASVFYGLKSKEYYYAQIALELPTIHKTETVKFKIIHVSYHDPAHLLGGQGWAVYNLCKAQIKRGNIVYWISPCVKDEKPGEYLYENGMLRVVKIKFTEEYISTLFADDLNVHKFRTMFGDAFVEKILQHFDPEDCVVHLHGFIETPKRAAELKKKKYRVISTFHMLLSSRNKKLINDTVMVKKLRELERLAIKSNSVITVPSNGMIEDLMEVYPDYAGMLTCVPNGIGDEHFTPLPQTSFSEQKTIVSYGRISPEKGFDLLIEATKFLSAKMSKEVCSSFRLIIFGNTDNTIEARRKYAEDLAKSADEYSNIKVMISSTGYIGLEKLRLIDKAGFGVVLSLYEPFGMVIPELMARGKAVITTLTPGARDVLQTNQIGRNDYGFIVEPNVKSIADALQWMLEHPYDVKIMGENARERANYYKWDAIAERFEQLYLQS
ncbi:MAG: glycosyltransferase [Clostridiaceae bacterium]|nr:glycosyltransferase [Clostridiaceae bacterium]